MRKYATVESVITKARELEEFDYRVQFNYSTVMNQFHLQVMELPEGASVNQIVFKVTLDIDDDHFSEELGFVYCDLERKLASIKRAAAATATINKHN